LLSLHGTTNEEPSLRHDSGNTALFAGICLLSADLDKSVWFYNVILGLPVLGKSHSQIQLDQHLVLRQSDRAEPAGVGTIVYIRHTDLDECSKRLLGASIEVSTSGGGRRRKLTCFDPDGRTVELIEA
jgi:catechol 2,3-dioxygenase-like lactoylglutathione lyase family enzyme